MENERRTLILYSTAVCNLKCVYCFIDKNPTLQKIDALLDESFKGDYYLDFAKEVFPDPNQLTEIQIWGGEPTLNLRRIIPTIKKLLNYYPNINEIMFSTNLAHDQSVDELFNFWEALKCNRPITLNMQLSLDGPKYITDANRGIGVTEKFAYNFTRMVANADRVLSNISNLTVRTFNKATLDIQSINQLQDKQSIIEYYKFFETFYKLYKEHNTSPRFIFNPTVPNTACPLPITKEIGEKFANLCRLSLEIEKENRTNKIFEAYKIITPYSQPGRYCQAFHNFGTCGQGKFSVGLLPEHMISTCHNGFTEMISEYKDYANKNNITELQNNFFAKCDSSSKTVFPLAELPKYERLIDAFYNKDDANYPTAMLGQIQLLAMAGQVESKYLDVTKAREAVSFIVSYTSICLRDNINISGTRLIVPVNLLKLLLNGAKEYIEESIKFADNDCNCNKEDN